MTLCKSVLGGLGVYLLSLYKAPSTLLKKLEGMRRDFFWGVSNDKGKIAWVAWDGILKKKRLGD